MPRSFTLMVLAAMFGGGWFYFGGKMPISARLSAELRQLYAAQRPQPGYYPQNPPQANYPPQNQYFGTARRRRSIRPNTPANLPPRPASRATAKRADDSHRFVQHTSLRRLEGFEALHHADVGRDRAKLPYRGHSRNPHSGRLPDRQFSAAICQRQPDGSTTASSVRVSADRTAKNSTRSSTTRKPSS